MRKEDGTLGEGEGGEGGVDVARSEYEEDEEYEDDDAADGHWWSERVSVARILDKDIYVYKCVCVCMGNLYFKCGIYRRQI